MHREFYSLRPEEKRPLGKTCANGRTILKLFLDNYDIWVILDSTGLK
jgi:hypothetical protein